jgi:hypothetical protein
MDECEAIFDALLDSPKPEPRRKPLPAPKK